MTGLFSLLAFLALPSQPALAQTISQAQALHDRGNDAGALQIAEALCRNADRAGCDLVEKLLLTRGKPGFDIARYVGIATAACQKPGGASMCGDASLVASGLAEGLTSFISWASVAAPGKRGCALGDARSCHAMSQLLTHKASPARDLVASIPFGRKACEGNMLAGCFNLMIAVQELPDPALGQYADDYLLAFDRACRLGTTKACGEVPRARKMKERAARYGAASAVHMLYVDNGIDQGNWGGSVIHALEESRAPAVVEYAVGRVAAAGKMTYVRQQDLPVIARMLGNSSAAQAARNEMTRRSGLAATPSPARPAADNSSYTNPGQTGARSGYSRCTTSNGKQGKRYWYYGFDNKVNYGACI